MSRLSMYFVETDRLLGGSKLAEQRGRDVKPATQHEQPR